MSRSNALALATYTRPLTRETSAVLPQWLFPGPHSRHVRAAPTTQISVPDYVTAAAPVTIVALQYQVPDGMIFSLRGVSVLAFVQSWNQGSGDLLFNLNVVSGGTRGVDFFQNVTTELGSTELPYPVGGRLEFESLDVLQWTATASANVAIGAPNNLVCMLWGHLYPMSERTDAD
jgi:hypothetical protein